MVDAFAPTIDIHCAQCQATHNHHPIYLGEAVRHLRCTFCKTVNAFTAEGKERSPTSPLDFVALTQSPHQPEPHPYRASGPFLVGSLITHPTFALGYILTVLTPATKMEVLFADKRRVLVCGPGSGCPPPPEPKKRTAKKRKPKEPASPPALPTATSTEPSESGSTAPVDCPKCGRLVHTFNLQRETGGNIVGCMYCYV